MKNDINTQELENLDALVGGLRKFAARLSVAPDDIFLRAELSNDLARAERASAAMIDLAWALRKELAANNGAAA